MQNDLEEHKVQENIEDRHTYISIHSTNQDDNPIEEQEE